MDNIDRVTKGNSKFRIRVEPTSLEHKLPLFIAVLLLAVILAISTAAFIEVRRGTISAASQRLSSVSQQLGALFQQSATQLRAQVIATARDPRIVAFAKGTSRQAGRAGALAALSATISQPEQVLGTQLRNGDGATILSSMKGVPGLDTLSVASFVPRARNDSAATGRFRLFHDTIVYATAARIADTDMFVVRWRRLVGSRRTREQITQLVGSDASVFLGNADGSVWSDLERPTAGPPFDSAAGRSVLTYERPRNSARYLVSASQIRLTPWIVAVDFPLGSVLAPVDRFLRRMTLIGILAVGIGLVVVWGASRRITKPLVDLTNAAGAIAAGQQSFDIAIDRSDELGSLGAAFNLMAREVRQSREDLERKVEERTREVHDTLRQLRDTQDALVRREKLALLGQLSSGVGHELRNPLGVMTNAVYFLRMVLASAPPNVHEYLGILQQQITLSEKIVSDLLDFARSKPPQRKAASVGEITSMQLARLGSTNGVRIDTDLPADLPCVLVDEVQVGQIVFNLLTNAMQAMDGKGRISISAAAGNGMLTYDVTDGGPGVPTDHVDKIFEPLFTTKARGIGLGLAVSRTLARANQGDLALASAPGQGARFRLTLPVVGEAAA